MARLQSSEHRSVGYTLPDDRTGRVEFAVTEDGLVAEVGEEIADYLTATDPRSFRRLAPRADGPASPEPVTEPAAFPGPSYAELVGRLTDALAEVAALKAAAAPDSAATPEEPEASKEPEAPALEPEGGEPSLEPEAPRDEDPAGDEAQASTPAPDPADLATTSASAADVLAAIEAGAPRRRGRAQGEGEA